MKTYYTLEVEVWNDSLEAREEAQKILNQEPISKENLLLAKYKKSVVAFLQSPNYSFISMAYKTYCNYFKKQKKVFLVPVITLVVEANKDTEPENFETLQKELETNPNLIHRFMFFVNDEDLNKKNEELQE